MDKINMENIGLSQRFITEASLYSSFYIGRVVSQYNALYKVITAEGELRAEIAGKFRFAIQTLSDYPAVGDFVMLDRNEDTGGNAIIHHVGQKDIPVDICREYLGEESIIGLSARTEELFEYIKTVDVSQIDYFGAGPLHKTATKLDCGLDSTGKVIVRSLDELSKLKMLSPIPVVVGGGVKIFDIPQLAQTKVDGFFVVSAVAEAENPESAASGLVKA